MCRLEQQQQDFAVCRTYLSKNVERVQKIQPAQNADFASFGTRCSQFRGSAKPTPQRCDLCQNPSAASLMCQIFLYDRDETRIFDRGDKWKGYFDPFSRRRDWRWLWSLEQRSNLPIHFSRKPLNHLVVLYVIVTLESLIFRNTRSLAKPFYGLKFCAYPNILSCRVD